MMESKIFFQNSNGDKLAGILTVPATNKTAPVVIICHGITIDKNRLTYTDLAKVFAENGIASLRFDFFGHGESEGDFAEITVSEGVDDVLQAIKYLKNRGYHKIALVGNSFGGQVSFVAATKTNELAALALISPVADYPEVERMRRSKKEILNWQKNGFIIHKSSKGIKFKLNYEFWQDIQRYICYEFADKIRVPSLIVHGTSDDIVPITQSRKMAKLMPDCEIREIEGANHRYTEEKHFKELIDTIGSFISNRLKNGD